jgi:hypothetical protein
MRPETDAEDDRHEREISLLIDFYSSEDNPYLSTKGNISLRRHISNQPGSKMNEKINSRIVNPLTSVLRSPPGPFPEQETADQNTHEAFLRETHQERLERNRIYYSTLPLCRCLDTNEDHLLAELLFERLLKEVRELSLNEPQYGRGEAQKRKFWDDVKTGLETEDRDSQSDETEDDDSGSGSWKTCSSWGSDSGFSLASEGSWI